MNRTAPGAPDPDRKAIQRVLEGDPSAYDEIVERHERPLRRMVVGIVGDRHLAEDVLQEAFLTAYRKLPRFRGEGMFAAWLYRIAVREAGRSRSRWRKLWRALTPFELEESAAPPTTSSAESDEELSRALDMLAALPDRERAAFVLHVVEGESYAEIAKHLKSTPGTVGSWIHRARGKLSEMSGTQQRTPSPATSGKVMREELP